MKLTEYLFRVGSNAPRALLLPAILALAASTIVNASVRPQYGGTLRVQVAEHITTIDPRQWPSNSVQAAAAERFDSLVFDRLVALDDHGLAQPSLAVSWQHDAQNRRWQFRLRQGVKFSDGPLLTPETAALALQQLLGNEFDVSANSDSVIIQADRSLADFPMQLASGRYYVFHVADDGSLTGTGPFRVAEWPAAETSAQAIFVANESCWAGRPYVDKIELTMGADPQQQANAIAFGLADVVGLPASTVRSAVQRGIRTVSSDPVELVALAIDGTRSAVQDAGVRQAISLAIDRASIADVILQREGAVAGSLLPNWISGYAHLFPVSLNPPRAKDLLAASGHELSRASPLVLVYDSSDAESRAVADRVSVNLREVGIMVQESGQKRGTKMPAADMRLVRHHLAAPDSAEALAELLNSLGEAVPDLETPEQIYAAERAPIDAFLVIPLVHVSESYGLSRQVRDWMAPRWGGWRLDTVWIEQPPQAGGTPQ